MPDRPPQAAPIRDEAATRDAQNDLGVIGRIYTHLYSVHARKRTRRCLKHKDIAHQVAWIPGVSRHMSQEPVNAAPICILASSIYHVQRGRIGGLQPAIVSTPI